MFASSSLPVEIWERILWCAISVPDFLDPSSFDGMLSNFELTSPKCDRNNEAAYWRAERHRNSFQRVCKSWDAYLRLFEHRFVRIDDLWHGPKLPPSALEKAVRVLFDHDNCGCDSSNPFGLGFNPDRLLLPWKSVPHLHKLEIIDTSREGLMSKVFTSSLAQRAEHVKTILARDYGHRNEGVTGYMIQVVDWFPELRNFHGQLHYFIEDAPDLNAPIMIKSNVETLSIAKLYQPGTGHGQFSCNFPKLRYLRIDGGFIEFTAFTEDLYPLLREVGSNLHTLHLNYSLHNHYQFPAKIWDWCPKLEKLGTNLRLTDPPLISHPFHTFIATPDCIAASSFDRVEFLEWPNVRTVVVDWTWDNVLSENYIPLGWRRKLPDKVIRIEDQNGLTWKESVELSSWSQPSPPKLVAGPLRQPRRWSLRATLKSFFHPNRFLIK